MSDWSQCRAVEDCAAAWNMMDKPRTHSASRTPNRHQRHFPVQMNGGESERRHAEATLQTHRGRDLFLNSGNLVCGVLLGCLYSGRIAGHFLNPSDNNKGANRSGRNRFGFICSYDIGGQLLGTVTILCHHTVQ